MASGDDTIRALREALRLSPDNMPLRLHLAESLLGMGRGSEAEAEFKEALARQHGNAAAKLGLARAFYQQGKNSQALVLIEDMLKAPDTPARAYILHARLVFRAGDVARAVRQYKRGLDLDPECGDPELAARLGIQAGSRGGTAEVVEGRVRLPTEAQAPEFAERFEKPQIAFKEVGGLEGVKEEIRLKIIHPLRHPDVYKAYGKPIGGGILMYGPPGCGKTHLARATAGEVQARFLAVGISDVLDMWIGASERNLHALFDQARRNKPCVLFFDEVDALGASRSDMRHSAGRHLINQFLSELDGVDAVNEGVLILAATNAPWHLDSAFRRPGRFDRIIFVPPPDEKARAAILRVLCQGKPLADADFEEVAAKSDGFSGADLKAAIDVAIEAKLKDAMRTGKPLPLTTRDLLAGVKTVKPSTREWFATARNYALYANQGGLYDDILKYLNITKGSDGFPS
ncbi:MAG: AAA family ATPase [Planctomycetota bacterium]|nr:AAA family ATPase [Planctomycetota bacterium]